MSTPSIAIVETTRNDPRVLALHDAKDNELKPRYADLAEPDENGQKREPYEPPLTDDQILTTLLIEVDGQPAGTIILRRINDKLELKRLVVSQEHRGLGLAKRLIAACEERARELGATSLWLHTGSRQPEAVGLYESTGWTRLPEVFEPYAEDGVSICFRKDIGEAGSAAAGKATAAGADVPTAPAASSDAATPAAETDAAAARMAAAQTHFETARAAIERTEKALADLKAAEAAMLPLMEYYENEWADDHEALDSMPEVGGQDAIWDLVEQQHALNCELLKMATRYFAERHDN